jgi:hypothetical protein
MIAVIGLQLGVRFGITGEIGDNQISVAPLEQVFPNRFKNIALADRKMPAEQQIERLAHFLVGLIHADRIVIERLFLRLIGVESENIHVLPADLFHYFDIRAVKRSYRHRPVQHEFHIAGSAGFCAGGGNLLGHIGRGNDFFRERYAIIRQKVDFQFIADSGIVIDHVGDIIDQLDDKLRHFVARRRLGAE